MNSAANRDHRPVFWEPVRAFRFGPFRTPKPQAATCFGVRSGWGWVIMLNGDCDPGGALMLKIKRGTGSSRRKGSHARVRLRRRFATQVGSRVLCAVLLGMLLITSPAEAAAGANINAVEGQSFTGNVVSGLLCPLASATISWGDGTTSAGSSDGSSGIQGTHTYAEEGPYTGSVTYTYTLRDPARGPPRPHRSKPPRRTRRWAGWGTTSPAPRASRPVA